MAGLYNCKTTDPQKFLLSLKHQNLLIHVLWWQLIWIFVGLLLTMYSLLSSMYLPTAHTLTPANCTLLKNRPTKIKINSLNRPYVYSVRQTDRVSQAGCSCLFHALYCVLYIMYCLFWWRRFVHNEFVCKNKQTILRV